jgi:hypothetical protein
MYLPHFPSLTYSRSFTICTSWSGRYSVSNRSMLFLNQNTQKEQGCYVSHAVAEKALLKRWEGGKIEHKIKLICFILQALISVIGKRRRICLFTRYWLLSLSRFLLSLSESPSAGNVDCTSVAQDRGESCWGRPGLVEMVAWFLLWLIVCATRVLIHCNTPVFYCRVIISRVTSCVYRKCLKYNKDIVPSPAIAYK